MSRPVERWLGTFMCTQYADVFEAHGYKTLQSVCQLDFHQLQSMGVRPEHCEKIMENVSVLRQSYVGGGTANMGTNESAIQSNPNTAHGVGSGYNMASGTDRRTPNVNYGANQMGVGPSQGMSSYPATSQMPPGIRYPYNQNQMYGAPSFGNYMGSQIGNQMWPKADYRTDRPYGDQGQQGGHYNVNQTQYQPNQQQQQNYRGQSDMYGGNSAVRSMNDALPNCNVMQVGNSQSGDGMSPSGASNMQTSSGNTVTRQSTTSSMQNPVPPHVHGSHASVSQSPQQVADSILQMASSNYQSKIPHSVAVSPQQYGHSYGVGPMATSQQSFPMPHPPGHYIYSGKPAIASPLSPVQIRSPASAHSGQSMTSASSSPMRSPLASGHEHSSVSSTAITGMQSPVPAMQQQPVCSPLHGNPPISSCSPVPHVNPSRHLSSSPGQHMSPMSQINPTSHLPPQSPLSQMKSPGHHSLAVSPVQTSGENFVPDMPVQHSNRDMYHTDCYPSDCSHSDYMVCSSKSSPRHYTELLRASQQPTSTLTSSYGMQYSSKCTDNFNPLQSLQKLVMLPESQVVDPKSVVSDTNMLSPEASKYEEGSSLASSTQLPSPSESHSLSVNEETCSDGKHCGTDVEEDLDSRFTVLESDVSKESSNRKSQMRKRCLKKAFCDSTKDSFETNNKQQELGQHQQQEDRQTRNIKRKQKSQLNELSEESLSEQRQACSNSPEDTHLDSMCEKTCEEQSQTSSPPSKCSAPFHSRETSICHCTVELEDISPLKYGKTQLNGFSDYTLFESKLVNNELKRYSEHCTNKNQENSNDAELVSPRAKRIRKRNHSISKSDTSAMLLAPIKQNGIHLRSEKELLSVTTGKHQAKPKCPGKTVSSDSCTENDPEEESINIPLERKQEEFSSLKGDEENKTKDKRQTSPSSMSALQDGGDGSSNVSLHDRTENTSSTDKLITTSSASNVCCVKSSVTADTSLHSISQESEIENHLVLVTDRQINVSAVEVESSSDVLNEAAEPPNHDQRQEITDTCSETMIQPCSSDTHEGDGTDKPASKSDVTTEKKTSDNNDSVEEYHQTLIQFKNTNDVSESKPENLTKQNESQTHQSKMNGLKSDSPSGVHRNESNLKEEQQLKFKEQTCSPETKLNEARRERDLVANSGNTDEVKEKQMFNNVGVSHDVQLGLEVKVEKKSEEFNGDKSQPVNNLGANPKHLHINGHCTQTEAESTSSGDEMSKETSYHSINRSLLTTSPKPVLQSEFEEGKYCDLMKPDQKANGLMKDIKNKDIVVVSKQPESKTVNCNDGIDFACEMFNGSSPTNSDSPTKASDKENPVEVNLRKNRRRRPFPLALKCLHYSSDDDEDDEFREPVVPKRTRAYGSRSPKLACVENKKQTAKNQTDVRLETLRIKAADVKYHNSIAECDSKPKIPAQKKSSIDVIVNRLSEQVVEKQIFTIAPVHVSCSPKKRNNSAVKTKNSNTCNHLANRRILRNSEVKSAQTDSKGTSDGSMSNIMCSDDVQSEGNPDPKLDKSPVVDCSKTSQRDVAENKSAVYMSCQSAKERNDKDDVPTDDTAESSGNKIEGKSAECASAFEPDSGCFENKTTCSSVRPEMKQDNLNEKELDEKILKEEVPDSRTKTKHCQAVGKNGICIRSKPKKSKRRFRSISEVGSDDEKLKKVLKINLEKKGKKDGNSNRQDSQLAKGPYIKVTGNREMPDLCEVVNFGHTEMDKQNKPLKPQSHIDAGCEALLKMSNHSPWTCVFCGRMSNENGSGDLFGPYFLDVTSTSLDRTKFCELGYSKAGSSPPLSTSHRNKVRKKTDSTESKLDKPKSHGTSPVGQKAKNLSQIRKGTKKTKSDSPSKECLSLTEVWMHEDCVVWTSGVFAMGGKMHGLEDALHIAKHSFCSVCKNSGATLGCFQKGCNQKYHYFCAVNTDCYLDEENFSMLCLRHKEKRFKASQQENR